ncbi:MAG: SoxR reducing system RseC family protein [Sterolibacterium sp.]|jgi:sigma-E factor negative regulatory protein RseC|nr:SoxR reducing system RseC family protein [Sterolibacterium sp.]
MENRGIVRRVEGDQVEVEVRPLSGGCGRCHEEGGCGSHLLNESLRPRQLSVYRLHNTINARVGDSVILQVAEGAVLRAALWAYLLPVLLLIAGTAVGRLLSPPGDERAPLLGAAAGLLLGLLVLRFLPSTAHAADGHPLLSMRLAAAAGAGETAQGCSRKEP